MKYLFILLLLVGCGSRKVNKTNTETTTKNEISVVDSVKIVTNTDSNTEIIADEFEIIPVDSLKPIVIVDSQGKKTSYLNARISKRHETSRNKTLKNEIAQSSRKINIKAEKQTKQAEKQVERKESIITSLWWLWLLIILVVTYYVSRKFISFRI
jgi:hypothetical protein